MKLKLLETVYKPPSCFNRDTSSVLGDFGGLSFYHGQPTHSLMHCPNCYYIYMTEGRTDGGYLSLQTVPSLKPKGIVCQITELLLMVLLAC